MTTSYTVWVKPEDGPLVVRERGDCGATVAWVAERDAILVADDKKLTYPHMDFVVRREDGHHGPSSLVYDTSDVRA
jgi:hypothetical protein